ncbi:MAG: ABC transporter ATP-binding protein, partial [Gammaproteobacteria bacterium]|nr:ABC transporter ATP-binding protein [Gammaproteobacteria bacterium]
MPALLEVTNLQKNWGNVTAVDGVSFRIEQGSCFGLLGPNGAGKTTTVEMLEGILTPSAGEIRYKQQPLGPAFREEAGIMFQSTALQDYMTVAEALKMFGSFYPRTRRFDELVESCSLEDFLNRDARKLSGGQRQRLLLAIALVNDPQVVFLDEPTTGLDPQARRNFWQLVERIKREGKTVILTTHYMDEAYQLCDELVFMDHGRIIAEGSPRELLASRFNDVIIQLPRSDVPDAVLADFESALCLNGRVEIASHDVNASIGKLLQHQVSLAGL